ncbi:mCG1026602 [Mus musculus]|nr:mCG1026602 [Mus musculus]
MPFQARTQVVVCWPDTTMATSQTSSLETETPPASLLPSYKVST